jgi:hypothetical protein
MKDKEFKIEEIDVQFKNKNRIFQEIYRNNSIFQYKKRDYSLTS